MCFIVATVVRYLNINIILFECVTDLFFGEHKL